MIALNNVNFIYDRKSPLEKLIFNDVNIVIDKRINLLAGVSGSGKSTLFKLLMDQRKPTSGTIDKPGDVLVVFQNVSMQIIMPTVYEEINLGYANRFNTDIDRQVIIDLLDYFGLNIDVNDNPLKLSGGQRKIITFISLFVLKPEVLILDEPFVNLDTTLRNKLIAYLQTIDSTLLISTHDIEDNYFIYQDVFVVEDHDISQSSLQETFTKKILKQPRGYNNEN